MFKKPLWQTVWTQIRLHQSVLGPCCLLLYGNVWQLFAADNFSRRHFQICFFLGALRVKSVSLGIVADLSLTADGVTEYVCCVLEQDTLSAA